MKTERLLSILLSATLLTLFTPSCVTTRPMPPRLANYSVSPYGKNAHLIRVPAGRDLTQVMADMDCGRDQQKCSVGDAGRIYVVEIGKQTFLIQQPIDESILALMNAIGCRSKFRCSTDGRTVRIEQGR